MTPCCKQFANQAQPKTPQSGTHDEVQPCTSCGMPLTLTFEERQNDDGSVSHVVIGVSD